MILEHILAAWGALSLATCAVLTAVIFAPRLYHKLRRKLEVRRLERMWRATERAHIGEER